MEGRGSAAGRLAVVSMVLVLAMVSGALAANHIVGGTQQWDYPPSNNLTYYDDAWAANQTFAAGDTLLFQYTANQHDVVQYNTVGEYDDCSGENVNRWTTGNDSVPLTAAGTYYFVCSYPGHCTSGMKVSVTVGAAVAPASPPTTAPSPSPTAPSPSPTTPPTTAPSPSPTTPPTTAPSPSPTTPPTTAPSPSPTTPPTTAPSPSPTTPSPPTTTPSPPPVSSPPPPPPNAASSGPVLSMVGILITALVAILAFLV